MSTLESRNGNPDIVFGEDELQELQGLEALYATTPHEVTDSEMSRLIELRELQIDSTDPVDGQAREVDHLMGFAAVEGLTTEEAEKFRGLIEDGTHSDSND